MSFRNNVFKQSVHQFHMPLDGGSLKGSLPHFARRFVVGKIQLQQMVEQQFLAARLVGVVVRKYLALILQNQSVRLRPQKERCCCLRACRI
ncbi:MAG: hypothetical protein ACI9NT_000419 [Bacteroidia bacterium]|jgi:hypothetical protein